MSPLIPDRRVFLSLLTAGICAAAPLALQLPPWAIAVFIGGGVWRYANETFHWYRPPGLVRIGLMLVIIAAVFLQYGALLGRDPGVALLITLLGLKFLELKTVRDFVVSLLLFYLVILGGFLYSQSLWLGAWSLVAVAAITAALIHLAQPSGQGLSQRLRLSGVMLVKALPLMILVYLLFPRISGSLWGLPADAYAGLTGMPERMQPGSIRHLSESSEVAFRVTFDGPPPPARELYWRGLVLEQTDGRVWSRAPEPTVPRVAFTPLNNPVRYQVTLEPSNKPWMPALDLPASLPPGAHYQPDFTLEHNEPIRDRLQYTLTSYTHYRTGTLDPTEHVYSLQLPVDLSPRVRALAEQWRRENADPLQVARAALDYFRRKNFVYTLDPPPLGNDPVDEFLFQTRRGFCEHFAAAFVTLMRAAGIPSRVVVGYLGGEFNPAGNYMIVRQSDAHAWAEIWTADNGWVRVDPTGAVAPERIEFGLDAVRRLEQQGLTLDDLPPDVLARALQLGWFGRFALQGRWYWDLTNLAWYRWVTDYGKERQQRFFASLDWGDISWRRVSGLLFGGVLLVALIYTWRQRTKKSADPALELYQRFCRELARAGLVRAPHEGALDFARRCAHQRPDIKNTIEAITERYLITRYGNPVNAPPLRDFRRAVAAFKV
ncbi:MAG: transglutaminase TgpA family protein [Sulfuricaulis sp.]